MDVTPVADPDFEQTAAGPPHTVLNVNLNPAAAAALRDYVEKRGISYTEAVRRAIAILAFVDEQLSAGRDMQVVDGDTVRRVVLIS
jgi:hypothetical protein